MTYAEWLALPAGTLVLGKRAQWDSWWLLETTVTGYKELYYYAETWELPSNPVLDRDSLSHDIILTRIKEPEALIMALEMRINLDPEEITYANQDL